VSSAGRATCILPSVSKYTIDTVLRVQLRHAPGQLARLAQIISEEGGILGDITTVKLAETFSVRDITVETIDEPHTERLVHRVYAMDDVELLQVTDRVFLAHEGGKLHSTSRVEVRQLSDLRYIYTPGVARVSRALHKDPSRAWDLTAMGRSVAICTNGTRVLGLGDIGPVASLPVMEGKAVIYDKFVGLSATPILIDVTDPADFVETVVRISRGFGAIHLEDIRVPDCFFIEDELKRRLDKPVMHDDQHGTATAALAAILNACRLTGLEPRRAKLGQIGLGAAGSAIARLALAYGVGEVLVTDMSKDAVARMETFGARASDLATIMRDAQIVIATTGRPGLIAPSMVRPRQVIFALSNPDPEIDPDDARAAGAAFAGDGRSINNALAFPGLFRAALDVRSRAIAPEMLVAAAEAIAAQADQGEVVPSPLKPHVHETVRSAVELKARQLGLAGTARV
jgi:malate dehydrogenase (oxaloacetate-decarboxylating)